MSPELKSVLRCLIDQIGMAEILEELQQYAQDQRYLLTAIKLHAAKKSLSLVDEAPVTDARIKEVLLYVQHILERAESWTVDFKASIFHDTPPGSAPILADTGFRKIEIKTKPRKASDPNQLPVEWREG